MSSTETGVIFGNIFYDGAATTDSRCVVLNDIHIDILDYITPGYCNEAQVSSFVLALDRKKTLRRLNTVLRSSGACGPSLSGRTRSTSTRTLTTCEPVRNTAAQILSALTTR